MHTPSNPQPLGTWQAGPDMLYPCIGHTATRLFDERILLAGGSDGNHALASSQLYDPISNT